MARQVVFIRTYRVGGPRKSRVPMRLRPVLAFVVLNLVVASLATVFVYMPYWRRDAAATTANNHHRVIRTALQCPVKIHATSCKNPESCR